MAMALQISDFLHQYLYSSSYRTSKKSSNALRFGVLSTAAINPVAFIHPAETHEEVVLAGIASRNYESAKQYAKKYGFVKAYGSYQDLIVDPSIDAVYISVPNGLHAEWAAKALQAGKHVLLEKPLAANAEEAHALFTLAHEKSLVLLEAFHYQFHPAAHVVHSLVHSGRYGRVLRTFSRMTTPAGSISKSDIRWKYELAGGSLMDMTYVISSTRYFLDVGTPQEVLSAHARVTKEDKRVDEAMEAELVFAVPAGPASDGEGGSVISKISTDMNRKNIAVLIPRVWEAPSIEIECEDAVIYFYNFMMPHLYHYISIKNKHNNKTTTQKHYNYGPKWGPHSEPWWSTYRYQLEAFVDKLRKREPAHWITPEDSIAQMETIDMVYEKSGLGKRGKNLRDAS